MRLPRAPAQRHHHLIAWSQYVGTGQRAEAWWRGGATAERIIAELAEFHLFQPFGEEGFNAGKIGCGAWGRGRGLGRWGDGCRWLRHGRFQDSGNNFTLGAGGQVGQIPAPWQAWREAGWGKELRASLCRRRQHHGEKP